MNKKNLLIGVCLAAAMSILTPLQTAAADLSISGWINEGMTYWDDGQGSSISQLSDNGTTLGSRITFAGKKDLIADTVNAGFEVILEPQSSVTPVLSANQDNLKTFNGGDIGLLGSSIHVGGNWGKVTMGLQSMPTDNIAVLGDPSLTIWSGISPVFRGNGFFIRGVGDGATNTTWGQFLQCLTTPGLGIGIDCNGIYRNGVRYDLPKFGPVSVAVGYANTDIYDIAAKYNDTLGPLKTILHLGYARNSNGGTNVGASSSDVFQVQAGLMHPDTGLFGTLAYQKEDADNATAGSGDDTDAYYLKVGIKKNWFGFGDTAFYGEFGMYNDQFGAGNADGISGSEIQRFGFSLDQNFSKELLIYGKYENLSLDVDGDAAAKALYSGAKDLSLFTLGVTYFF
ncbi:MAG: porin [Gammaproteobacteria bacterium]|nr:porin [Gammaproteobacteria bacterium]